MIKLADKKLVKACLDLLEKETSKCVDGWKRDSDFVTGDFLVSPFFGKKNVFFIVHGWSIEIGVKVGKKREKLASISIWPFTKKRKLVKAILKRYKDQVRSLKENEIKESLKSITPSHIQNWRGRVQQKTD